MEKMNRKQTIADKEKLIIKNFHKVSKQLGMVTESLIEEIKLEPYEEINWNKIHEFLIIKPNLTENTTFDDMVFNNLINGNRPSKGLLNIYNHIWENIKDLYNEKYKDINEFKKSVKNIWPKNEIIH